MIQGDIVDKKQTDQSVRIQDSVVNRSSVRGGGPKYKSGQSRSPSFEGSSDEDDSDRYEAALRQAWDDGVITKAEGRLLQKLRRKCGISMDEHNMLEAMIKREMGLDDKKGKGRRGGSRGSVEWDD